MMRRIKSEDLKFFVSVIIQRETGGNLIEVLENIGHLIKERFRFHGVCRPSPRKEGSRHSPVAMPICIAIFFSIFRPEYIGVLITDDIGRVLATEGSS